MIARDEYSKYDNRFYRKVSVIEKHCVIYKAIWTPAIGKKLSVQYEHKNKHAADVIKDSQIIGLIHFVTISLLCLCFPLDGADHSYPQHLL